MQMRDEPSVADLQREYPGWFIHRGICQLWYGRIPGADPPVIVRGQDLTDLRDEIRRYVGTRP